MILLTIAPDGMKLIYSTYEGDQDCRSYSVAERCPNIEFFAIGNLDEAVEIPEMCELDLTVFQKLTTFDFVVMEVMLYLNQIMHLFT